MTIGVPQSLSTADPESERRRYAVVRLDTMAVVPGLIMIANCETGMCVMRDDKGESKEHHFGPGGLRIVAVGR
jgi:hypothetical protein